jgi:hypothetical protein
MSKDLTSRRHFLSVAGTAAGAAVFGPGIALDSAALVPECAAAIPSQSATSPADYTLRIGASPIESRPNTSSRSRDLLYDRQAFLPESTQLSLIAIGLSNRVRNASIRYSTPYSRIFS